MEVGQKIYCNKKQEEVYADDVPCTNKKKEDYNACEECPHSEEF